MCVGFGIRLVISLAAIPVPTVLVDFAFPVTFAIGFLGLVALVGFFLGLPWVGLLGERPVWLGCQVKTSIVWRCLIGQIV